MSTENIRSVKESLKLKAWALEVKQQQDSGLNATAWCRLNGIKPSSFYHRLKRVREATLKNTQISSNAFALPIKTPAFAEIDIMKMQDLSKVSLNYESTSAITVSLNGATIEIPANASAKVIATVLNVVKTL